MVESTFIPENPLEELLVKAQSGVIPLCDLLAALMQSDVFIPSASEVNHDGTGLVPMLFDRNGQTMMSVFTSRSRAKKYAKQFPYCLAMNGTNLAGWISRQYGVVINPGYRCGLEIPAKGVEDIYRDFAS